MVPRRLWRHNYITCSYSNKILFLPIGHVRRLSYCLVTLRTSSALRCGRPTHRILIRWTIPSGLSWSSAYTRTPGADSEHWWTSAASANRLERTWAADHWQCCQPVERSFGSLCARRGRTFWAHTLKLLKKQFTRTRSCRWLRRALKYTDSLCQNVLFFVFLKFSQVV